MMKRFFSKQYIHQEKQKRNIYQNNINTMIKEPDFDNLTPEEQEIEDSLESGEYVSVPATEEQKKELQAIARYTLEKTRTISVRLTERDLMHLKATAAREGIPYQTFLTSLIHKNV
jgi:predicted DNA binding CopG/RHH family protein